MRRRWTAGRWFPVSLLALAALVIAVTVPVVSLGAAFSAKSSVQPLAQYLSDTTGTVFTFTIDNTGSSATIGAVEISRPSSFWTVTACPQAPAGWTTQRADTKCRYRSVASTSDDIPAGTSNSQFKLTATTLPGSQDVAGTWGVTVSKSDGFDDASKLSAAASEPPGLTTTAYSFQVLDAVVANGPTTPGSACPSPSKQAIAGSTHTIVICGRNRMNVAATPTAAQSSLGGTFIQASGTFSSGSIAANSGSSRVLGNWNNATISGAKGTGKTVIAKIGATSKQTSPLTTLAGFEVTNQAPTADVKTATLAEDGSKAITLSGADPDGDPLTFSVVSGPSNGALGPVTGTTCSGTAPKTCTATVTYTPNANYNGQDSFTYKATDGFADSNSATVSITVDPVNDAPTAQSTSVGVVEDGSKAIDLSALAGDVETPAANLAISVVTPPVHGSYSGGTYTPDPNFNGSDSFVYKVTDRGDPDNCSGAPCAAPKAATGTISITVSPVNDTPTAASANVSTDEDTPLGVDLTTLVGDVETSTANLTISVVTPPAHGSYSGGTYTPETNFNGSDSFVYKVTDRGDPDNCASVPCDAAKSASATVSITVNAVNDAPVTKVPSDTIDVVQDTDAPIAGVSISDPDAAGDDVQLDLAVGQGTVSLNPLVSSGVTMISGNDSGHVTATGTLAQLNATLADANGLVYHPNPGYTGPDALTVTTNDLGHTGSGGAKSDTGTVQIRVRPANVAPTAAGQSVSTSEDTAKTITLKATDPDGPNDLTFAIASNPAHGQLGPIGAVSCDHGSPNACSAAVTYTPDPGFNGSDSFTFTANDGAADSDPAAVSITVLAVNACTAPGQKLGNPGFEQGNTVWTHTAAIIGQWAPEQPPHSGTWNAWLNGYGTTHTDTLSQTVTLPAGCTNYLLTFWLHIDSAETSTTTAFDTLTVKLGNTTLAAYSNLNKAAGYKQQSFNVAALAGQTVTLMLTGTEDTSLQTSFVVDDFALTVS